MLSVPSKWSKSNRPGYGFGRVFLPFGEVSRRASLNSPMFERNCKGVPISAGNCPRRTPISMSLWRRRAPKKRGWAATTRSFYGVFRPAHSCPRHPPHCTVLFRPPPSPRPLCSHLRPLPGVTPPLTAMAARSRLNTSPPPTDPLPIKIFPRDQPLKEPQPITITPRARPHPPTEPIAVILHLVSALRKDKLAVSQFTPLPALSCMYTKHMTALRGCHTQPNHTQRAQLSVLTPNLHVNWKQLYIMYNSSDKGGKTLSSSTHIPPEHNNLVC